MKNTNNGRVITRLSEAVASLAIMALQSSRQWRCDCPPARKVQCPAQVARQLPATHGHKFPDLGCHSSTNRALQTTLGALGSSQM
ncbi:MAG TPA: hypothetical protein DIT96_13935 [Pseudomonas sp.]|nr:hypothetical protein [Pseudomonas sp.]